MARGRVRLSVTDTMNFSDRSAEMSHQRVPAQRAGSVRILRPPTTIRGIAAASWERS